MKMRIALLISTNDVLVDGNYLRFANQLAATGHDTYICPVDSLAMARSEITVHANKVDAQLVPDAPMPAFTPMSLTGFDLVWVLSLGLRESFLDKIQLLFNLAQVTRVVNSIDAIMHLKSKYFIARHPEIFQHPATWTSTRPDEILSIMQREGGRFVVKPPAGSFGRDVYRLSADSENVHVILESMCGPDEDRFVLLQRYVEEVTAGEKRVLIAGGVPVGAYLRVGVRDHRTNVHQGSETSACELTAEEAAYCRRIGAFLAKFGAVYVGIDLVFPWVIEFNVVNPGGITTIETLTGKDVSCDIVQRIVNP